MRPIKLALAVVSNHLGTVPRPGWCTYLVCYRCNARCKMCDSWRMKPGSEMTAAQVRQVFAKIGRLDVVRLTGGEPFLREDLDEVAASILEASAPDVLHITSNGSFPDRAARFVERFPRPGLLRFMISFDGLEPEHDASRGQDVSFATAFETVRRLAALRRRSGIKVSVNHTVISLQSLEDHDGLCRRLEPLGVDVHAVLAYSDSAMYGAKRFGKKAEDLIVGIGYPLHPKLKGADTVGFVRRQLGRLKQVRDPVLRIGKRYYLRGLLARLRGHMNPRPHPKCVALRSHIRLLPDGSVPVCQFNTEKVGNLLTQSFEEVWQGAQTDRAREWVDACVGCWAECEVMPSAIYSGDLLRSLT
jgi:MoaA/NifB/PqqE/SkfB family radical SAM enzyme